MMETAFDSVRDSYDIETLREIRDHGCASGVAHDHIYYSDTIKFFDEYEDEIVEYIADVVGGEYNEEIWKRNPCHIAGYKNDTAWCFIEIVAGELVSQYEETTCEELSDSDEYTIDPDGEVVFKADLKDLDTEAINSWRKDSALDEIDFDFSSKGDTLTAKPLNATTYDAVKELASTPWGQDHLEIISA